MSKALLYGFITGLGLIAYFLLMSVLGLERNFYLRLLNFFIIVGGIYFLFSTLIDTKGRTIGYIEGLGAGLTLSLVSIITFIIFLVIYITYFNPAFMSVLEESRIWGTDLKLSEAAFGIGLEGVVSGFIVSFIWMQYFKRDVDNQDEI